VIHPAPLKILFRRRHLSVCRIRAKVSQQRKIAPLTENTALKALQDNSTGFPAVTFSPAVKNLPLVG
jgi:hypothetical protein